eukprot:CAMPEP_0115285286 /NCGR_PEP_ID=MMETSP0270-20121206/61345_1 /TAXON_ID=71861 /ORGANISM="Scrippsiella trochoidea, Strain CCMP3099" /LENGTH=136 /DNA_ID=CAMNT_0002702289 /DNA_START=204 /DNA_END=614 /DNA_ORIENTATION=-
MADARLVSLGNPVQVGQAEAEHLGDATQHVHMILAGKKWLAADQLHVYASNRPQVHWLEVLFWKHCQLRCMIPPSGAPRSHPFLLSTSSSEAEVANPQSDVLVDQNAGWLQVTMDNARGVQVLQTPQHLASERLTM